MAKLTSQEAISKMGTRNPGIGMGTQSGPKALETNPNKGKTRTMQPLPSSAWESERQAAFSQSLSGGKKNNGSANFAAGPRPKKNT